MRRSGGRRHRFALGGKWALASLVMAMLGFYLLAFTPFVVAGEPAAGDVLVVVGGGLLVLAAGLAGLWLTVPPAAKDLVLDLDETEVRRGGVVSGTLRNASPGTPVEVAALCRGTSLDTEGVGASDRIAVHESTLTCRADVDPGLAEQRFSIEIPPRAPVSRRTRSGSAVWWVVARRPGERRRRPVTMVPITVRL